MDLSARITRNQRFLADLFAGPFRGHALIVDPALPARPWADDVSCPNRPVADWLPWALDCYEAQRRTLEAVDDDSVPFVPVFTGTQVFAAAFGCAVHLFEGSNPAALPLVSTAEDADRLAEPTLDAEPIRRVLEFVDLVRRQVGPDVPIAISDIQSPFDIANLIWQKESLLLALYDTPEAVHRLVAKCHRLLVAFLEEFRRRAAPSASLVHYPRAWAPPALGCWLSEDDVGSISCAQFAEFALPHLVDLSRRFGGLFMHCCAAADHQHPEFLKIPNLRGINRFFQEPGPGPAIAAFSGRTVLMIASSDEATIGRLLDQSRPDTRWLFNLSAPSLDEAKGAYDRLRARCPRTGS